MRKNVLKLPVSFAGSHPDQWWANFSSAKNLILQKTLSGIDKVLNFKDFSRPSRVTESKDFNFNTTTKNSRPFQDCTSHGLIIILQGRL